MPQLSIVEILRTLYRNVLIYTVLDDSRPRVCMKKSFYRLESACMLFFKNHEFCSSLEVAVLVYSHIVSDVKSFAR